MWGVVVGWLSVLYMLLSFVVDTDHKDRVSPSQTFVSTTFDPCVCLTTVIYKYCVFSYLQSVYPIQLLAETFVRRHDNHTILRAVEMSQEMMKTGLNKNSFSRN